MTTAVEKLSASVAQAANPDQPRRKTLADLINEQTEQMKLALPAAAKMTPERMARIALTTIRVNPALAACTPPSFLGALMTSAQLGLELGGPLGHAYPVPFTRNGQSECTFILGYKGMIELARRAGTHVETWEVHEHDDFVWRRGNDAAMTLTPKLDGDRGRVIGYAVYARWEGGWYGNFMRHEDVLLVRNRSKGYNPSKPSGPWHSDFTAMARKTVLRASFNANEIPVTVEIAQALNADETVAPIDVNELDRPRDDYDEPGRWAGATAVLESAEIETPPLETEAPDDGSEPFFDEPQDVDAGEAGDREDQRSADVDPVTSPAPATIPDWVALPDDVDSLAWIKGLDDHDVRALAVGLELDEPPSMQTRHLQKIAAKLDELRAAL